MDRNKSFMKTLKRNGPNLEPRGTWSFLPKSYSDLIFSFFVYDLLNTCGLRKTIGVNFGY